MKTTQNKNRYRKIKLLWGVCSAGVKFCIRAEACSSSISSIMLRCGGGGLEWPWVRDSLAYVQYRPKHVVVHYIVIKYTSCDTVVFDYIQFSKQGT